MDRIHRLLFGVVLFVAILAGLWSFTWYKATSSVFSDLARHGIVYGSHPYREIVAITERHILGIVTPIAVLLVVSLIGWGYTLYCGSRMDAKTARRSGM